MELGYMTILYTQCNPSQQWRRLLAWIHSTAGLVSPIGSPLVKATLQGLQRILARLVHKKAPATVRMLEQMVHGRFKTDWHTY